MKKKILASLSIFLLLVSLAWALDKKDKREFYSPDEEGDVVEIFTTDPGLEIQKKKYRMFKAREYVRIERP
ncbi:hypothetical protein M3175_07525 [Robertmurraya korlensis]|uniref:hypothetical protein n=1 Tax=Robertmurraya korlensis TaxID=519977 RepID=UPI00203B7D53|nr:hypothetical protein [Robertmurraya korlensis]MCM3600576.1 hypothetical protein [Robertmurraya korlensis]